MSLLGGASREGRVEGLDLLPSLFSLLLPPADANITLQQSAEFTATILQSLCDQVTQACLDHMGYSFMTEHTTN